MNGLTEILNQYLANTMGGRSGMNCPLAKISQYSIVLWVKV